MESGINFQSNNPSTKTIRSNSGSASRNLIVCLIGILLLSIFLGACKKVEKTKAPRIENRDSMAVMETEEITMLISDSGITKYRILTKSWDVYDRTQIPRWVFENGLFMEQFDRDYKVNATIKSDTAYYYTLKKIWELRGNVEMNNTKGEQFFTSQLFWDQNTAELYSNRKIRIIQPDKTINGTSFMSNQDMTEYKIFNTDGHVAFDEEKLHSPDSVSDSTPGPVVSDPAAIPPPAMAKPIPVTETTLLPADTLKSEP